MLCSAQDMGGSDPIRSIQASLHIASRAWVDIAEQNRADVAEWRWRGDFPYRGLLCPIALHFHITSSLFYTLLTLHSMLHIAHSHTHIEAVYTVGALYIVQCTSGLVKLGSGEYVMVRK